MLLILTIYIYISVCVCVCVDYCVIVTKIKIDTGCFPRKLYGEVRIVNVFLQLFGYFHGLHIIFTHMTRIKVMRHKSGFPMFKVTL
jgi:hypothetical protein